MAYKIRKAPKRDLYWVVAQDGTKKSKDPIPLERAKAQMRALYAVENEQKRGAGIIDDVAKIKSGVDVVANAADQSGLIKALSQGWANMLSGYNTANQLTGTAMDQILASRGANISQLPPLQGVRKLFGGQLTDEQITKYEPTLAAAIQEYKPGDAPTKGAYERYKRGVEKSQARGMKTRLMSYDEWASLQRRRDTERQVGVQAANKQLVSELPGLVEGWESLEADPLVECPYDLKGAVKKTRMRKSECKVARDEWEKREHPENYYFFRPAVTGLVKAADFAAENIAPLLPGVGKLTGELYKGVRDAVGPTEYDGAGHMHPAGVKARRIGGRRYKGRGWFSNAFKSVQRLASSAVQRVKDVFKGVRQDFSPSVRQTLAQVGSSPVVEMVVRRDPIQSLLNKALNVISLGSWDKLRAEYHYDELFHLGVEVTVRISPSNEYVRRYVIEKNEVINVAPAKAYTDKTQTWRVPMSDSTTIDQLLANTRLVMGPNFFTYDPFKNNCQDFIYSLLVANGYATPELKSVVKQPMEDLVSKLPGFTGKIAKAVTDIGAIANVALEGQGKQSELAKSVMIKNTMKNNLKTLEDEYVRLYMTGEIAEAEELYKLIKESQKALRDAEDAFAFKDLPKVSPGAAADWSTPRGKGKASRRAEQNKPLRRFLAQLETAGVDPKKYLAMARRYAKRAGYSEKIQFSDKSGKKLMIDSPSGPVHFGAVGHGDFLLYSLQGDRKLADEKRRLYLSRAQKIKGDWKEDKYSPNNLAIRILWPPISG
jgi:hypothetical protein